MTEQIESGSSVSFKYNKQLFQQNLFSSSFNCCWFFLVQVTCQLAGIVDRTDLLPFSTCPDVEDHSKGPAVWLAVVDGVDHLLVASSLSSFLGSEGSFFWNVYFCTFRKIHNLYLYLFFQYFFHNLASCAGVFNWLLVTHQSLCSFFLCCLQWSFTRLTNAVQKENTSGPRIGNFILICFCICFVSVLLNHPFQYFLS